MTAPRIEVGKEMVWIAEGGCYRVRVKKIGKKRVTVEQLTDDGSVGRTTVVQPYHLAEPKPTGSQVNAPQ